MDFYFHRLFLYLNFTVVTNETRNVKDNLLLTTTTENQIFKYKKLEKNRMMIKKQT